MIKNPEKTKSAAFNYDRRLFEKDMNSCNHTLNLLMCFNFYDLRTTAGKAIECFKF